MKKIMLGEFTRTIYHNGIYIPKKFEMAEKTLEMLLIKDQEWLSVQLWEEMLPDTQSFLESEYELLEKATITAGKNGYVKLPDKFMEQLSGENQVIVTGVGDCVEVMTLAEVEEMDQSLGNFEKELSDLWDF